MQYQSEKSMNNASIDRIMTESLRHLKKFDGSKSLLKYAKETCQIHKMFIIKERIKKVNCIFASTS